MVKISCRKLKKSSEVRFDIRSLSLNEYKMLVELVRAASDSYANGYKTEAVGSFDISYIDTRVFSSLDSLNTLAKLEKIL